MDDQDVTSVDLSADGKAGRPPGSEEGETSLTASEVFSEVKTEPRPVEPQDAGDPEAVPVTEAQPETQHEPIEEIEGQTYTSEVPYTYAPEQKTQGKRCLWLKLLIAVGVVFVVTFAAIDQAKHEKVVVNDTLPPMIVFPKSPDFMLPDKTSACTVEKVQTKDGWDACDRACAVATCCHEPPMARQSCRREFVDLCDSYDTVCALLELYSEHQSGGAPTEEKGGDSSQSVDEGEMGIGDGDWSTDALIVSDVCSELSLTTAVGRESCYELCQPRMCCLFLGSEGLDYPVDQCDHFQPCEAILKMTLDDEEDREVGISFTLEFVASLCSNDSLLDIRHVAECHRLCDPHMCCFVEKTDSCKAKALSKCDVFEPCRTLLVP